MYWTEANRTSTDMRSIELHLGNAEHERRLNGRPCGCPESVAWRVWAEELWSGGKGVEFLDALLRLRAVSREPDVEPCCDRGLEPGHAGRCIAAP